MKTFSFLPIFLVTGDVLEVGCVTDCLYVTNGELVVVVTGQVLLLVVRRVLVDQSEVGLVMFYRFAVTIDLLVMLVCFVTGQVLLLVVRRVLVDKSEVRLPARQRGKELLVRSTILCRVTNSGEHLVPATASGDLGDVGAGQHHRHQLHDGQ